MIPSNSHHSVPTAVARTLHGAQVRVGTLLRKRMVKPASVMVQWGRQQNPALPGVLSRGDFRRAMIQLFTDRFGPISLCPYSRAHCQHLALLSPTCA